MNSAEKASKEDVWETHPPASAISSIAKPFLKMALITKVAQIFSTTHWQDTEHIHTCQWDQTGIRSLYYTYCVSNERDT